MAVPGRGGQEGLAALRHPEHLALNVDDPLRGTSRAGGVDQRGDVLGLDLAPHPVEGFGVALVFAAAQLEEVIPADEPIVCVAHGLHHHDAAQQGELATNGSEAVHEAGVFDEGEAGVAVAGDVLDLLWRQGVVEADRGALGVLDGEVGDQVLGAVARHDHAELTGPESERPQAQGDAADKVAVLSPRQAMPAVLGPPIQGAFVMVAVDSLGESARQRLVLDRAVQPSSFGEDVSCHATPPSMSQASHRTGLTQALPGGAASGHGAISRISGSTTSPHRNHGTVTAPSQCWANRRSGDLSHRRRG